MTSNRRWGLPNFPLPEAVWSSRFLVGISSLGGDVKIEMGADTMDEAMMFSVLSDR